MKSEHKSLVYEPIPMVARLRGNVKEIVDILNKSSNDWSEIESKRKCESLLVIYKSLTAITVLQLCDHNCHQFSRLYFSGSPGCKDHFWIGTMFWFTLDSLLLARF